MLSYEDIKSVHLEISTRCNASCPLCPRNVFGYDMELGYPVHDMSLTEVKKIFEVNFLKQLTDVLINGNLGDFVTAREGLQIVQYFVESNSNLKILISTNGGAKPSIWSELGKLPNVSVGFAIDGLEDTHSLYRRNTNWQQVITNATNFIKSGGHAVWRMVKFDHNEHQIEECKKLSVDLGFKKFELLNDGRQAGPVYDKNGNLSYILGSDQRFGIRKYPERVEDWGFWVWDKKHFTSFPIEPKTKEKNCKSTEYKQIYITATGEVYPCCWLGFYPHSEYKRPFFGDQESLRRIALNNNALELGLKNAINYFNKIESAWQKDYYREGRLATCDAYCNKT